MFAKRLNTSLKNGKKISALTCYDYPTARLLDEAGIDILLVGDSLGMVVLGMENTCGVTMKDMMHHTKACSRAVKKALLVADLPYNSYSTPDKAVKNANLLIKSGAQAVKLEGGKEVCDQIKLLTKNNIKVMAHIGMLPQNVVVEGGYSKKGKTKAEAKKLIAHALEVEKAGAFAVVLECIKDTTSRKIVERLKIPTIGIGAGKGICDGEILVYSDVVGAYPWFKPSFAKQFSNISDTISNSAKKYIKYINQ